MSEKTKIYRPRTRKGAARHSARRTESGGTVLLRAAAAAFAGGIGVCLLLLALFALLLAHAPVPLTLVRPLACAAAAAGVLFSGWLLAKQIGRRMLLCGLCCGAFYAACQLAATCAVNGSVPLDGGALMLPLALLFSGTAGGALAAVRAGS